MFEKILQWMDSFSKFANDDRFLKFMGSVCTLLGIAIVFVPEGTVPSKYIMAFLSVMGGYGIYSSSGRVRNGIKPNSEIKPSPPSLTP